MIDYLLHFFGCIFAGEGIVFIGMYSWLQFTGKIDFDFTQMIVAGVGIGIFLGLIYAIPYLREEHRKYKQTL